MTYRIEGLRRSGFAPLFAMRNAALAAHNGVRAYSPLRTTPRTDALQRKLIGACDD